MLAMPRQTHPRTVASIKPPGTEILRRAERDLTMFCLSLARLTVNKRNAVQQRKVAGITHAACKNALT